MFEIFRATMVLEAYSDLDWIRHPDMSSALIIALMQLEGKGVKEAMKFFKEEIDQMGKEKGWGNKKIKVSSIKAKNQNLNS